MLCKQRAFSTTGLVCSKKIHGEWGDRSFGGGRRGGAGRRRVDYSGGRSRARLERQRRQRVLTLLLVKPLKLLKLLIHLNLLHSNLRLRIR